MALADELGLDLNILKRRIAFLESRAEARLEQGEREPLTVAAAGGLYRDAAILALLADESDSARGFFRRSGQIWASLGLFAGLTLSAIGGDFDVWDRQRSSVLRAFDESLESSEPVTKSRGSFGPFLTSSISSARQLLSLLEATSLRERLQERSDPEMRQRIAARIRYISTDAADLSPELLALFGVDAAKVRDESEGYVRLLRAQAESLQVLREDQYHWVRVFRPSALLDIDLLVFAAVHRESHERWDSQFDSNALVRLPVTAARMLTRGS